MRQFDSFGLCWSGILISRRDFERAKTAFRDKSRDSERFAFHDGTEGRSQEISIHSKARYFDESQEREKEIWRAVHNLKMRRGLRFERKTSGLGQFQIFIYCKWWLQVILIVKIIVLKCSAVHKIPYDTGSVFLVFIYISCMSADQWEEYDFITVRRNHLCTERNDGNYHLPAYIDDKILGRARNWWEKNCTLSSSCVWSLRRFWEEPKVLSRYYALMSDLSSEKPVWEEFWDAPDFLFIPMRGIITFFVWYDFESSPFSVDTQDPVWCGVLRASSHHVG